MQDHLRDWGISFGGTVAAAGLDVGGAPAWLTMLAAVLTVVHTGYKIALVRLEIKLNRQKLEKKT